MLAAKRSEGVAPEVNLGECITLTPLPSANKAEPTVALKPTRRHQKFKNMGIRGPTKRTCVHPKNKKISLLKA